MYALESAPHTQKKRKAGQAENDVASRYGAVSRLIISLLNHFIFKYQSLCLHMYVHMYVNSMACNNNKKIKLK